MVHGRWLTHGLPPAFGEDEEEGSNRERLLRWLESRHRAAPGYDWHAIEAENLRASLAFIAKQDAEKARAAKPVWHERGPVNQTGATALVAFRPDGKTTLVGTSQAGVFGGAPGNWKRLTDTLGGYLHGLLVSEKPEVWVAGVSGLRDGHVYVSRNRGAAWSPAKGLPPLDYVYEMIQDGGNHRVIYLLGRTLVENSTLLPFVARSRDGGLSFSMVWRGEFQERPGLWTSRVATGPLYLVSHGQIFLSNDQGSSFSPLGQVTANTAENYVVLRGSEAGAPTLYAAAGKSTPGTLYVSEDGGFTWASRFQLTGTSYYGLDVRFAGGLDASIRDPNLVLFGNLDAFRSTDAGRTFERVNQWDDYYDRPGDRLHGDINGLQFVLDHGQEKVFFSTDGGTYLSTNGGLDVRNITETGLPTGQFYSTWSSASNPDLWLAGSQDQGLQLSVPNGRTGTALSNAQLISGDYSGLTSASHGFTDVFAIYPTSKASPGALMLFQPGGEPGALVSVDLPKLDPSGFFAASAADPDDPATVYVAGDHIWKMTHLGNGRFSQSQLPQSFSPDGFDYVSALVIAPSDHNVWYATTVEGRLWYSRDRGKDWTESDTTQAEEPTGSNGTLVVSATDPFTCYAGGSGYGNPSVWVTHDGGANWSPLANGLPSTTVWALAFDGAATPALYAATETGPFVLDGSTWRSLLGGGAPPGRYHSVEGVPSAKLVRFGTYSRGVWDYVPPPRR